MKEYFSWYYRDYEIINPATKKAQAFYETFAEKWTPDGVSLYDCYNNPSHCKRDAYSDLVSMFTYTTITGFNCMRFTAMSTLDGLNALFVDTGVNRYVVADSAALRRFASKLGVGFCKYQKGEL